nr:metallopeptidase TldD-related protein [Halomicronema hongdechloris]
MVLAPVTVTPASTVDPMALFDEVLSILDLPADWIGMRAQRTTGSQRTLRDGRPQQNHRYRDQGAMVEVLVAGQLGYAASNQLTVTGLQAAAHQAYQQAQAAAPWQLQAFSSGMRPRELGLYTSSVLQPPDQISGGDINALLAQICQGLNVSEQIVQTIASLHSQTTDIWLLSSSGTRVQQQFTYFGTHFGATAQAGAVVQTRHHNGPYAHYYQGGWEHLAEAEDLWQAVQQAAEQAVELLTAPECPTMTSTLVLAPDQMLLQIHESIGHPLELDRILGDERNYAGGSFVKPEDFGQLQYGSPLLNVTFDPTLEHQLASYGFDDTGVGARTPVSDSPGGVRAGPGRPGEPSALWVTGGRLRSGHILESAGHRSHGQY